ncbi:uncharacterized protein B0H64DRAFT_174519 [Chaetomium fimeti]|uniref:PIN domain-containing protein n=1 Tax=Chaetomium fimeti TaxID=1854472 RepID=A0AAE0HCF7_9PEZI|nr:hypothetical protein B0H64DRAFT_174519 [Chaetomium fimeti]
MTTETLAASQGQSLSESNTVHFPSDHNLPGKFFEPRQNNDTTGGPSSTTSSPSTRWAPQSHAFSATRPTPCYHDELGYAADRYQIAGQWFGLPYIFSQAESQGHEVVTNDRDLIQFRHEIEWRPKLVPVPKVIRLRALVSLALDPASVDGGFIRVKYHKDQASVEDYSKEGVAAMLKKWQAEATAKVLSTVDSDVRVFAADKGSGGG